MDQFLSFDVVEVVVYVLFDTNLLWFWLDVADVLSMLVAVF